MSRAADAPALWIGQEDPAAARERLRKAVAALTRARRLQVLADHAFGGLLAGLCLATAAVLVARQLPSPHLVWPLAGGALLIALVVAVALGWRRRPDSLDVAIRADIALRLKQRLSTAWEFMTVHGENELGDRLAQQAVRAGLPARAATVFPLRVNRWGWLAPLAAAALLLASVVDLDGARSPSAHKVDEQVVDEGQRLGAFGREMRSRARRDQLPRSAQQAARLEQLGARMESGGLTRDQALGQLARMGESLDEERTQALAEAQRGSLQRAPNARPAPALAADLDPGAMLERMQRGALGSDDIGALARRMDDLERSGIPRRELQNALDRQQAGADDALREILEKLTQLYRALKEDKELQNALEQVRRAQDNLGAPRATADGRSGAAASVDWDEDEREERGASGAAEARSEGRSDSPGMGRGSHAASQADSSIALERADAPLPERADPAGRVLRPESQMRAGEEFSSRGRMLPRVNRPSVESVQMGSEFAAQAESVLSKDQYPEHYKEFVRRYFLTLSQGRRAAPHEPAADGK